jgi:hypothetical protein
MSTDIATAETVPRSPTAPAPWLVGPVVDALFVANVLWPLVLFLPYGPAFDGHDAVHFWQLYYVTTPHRWITLLFVILDRDRLRATWGSLVALGVGLLAASGAVRWGTGDITCLLAVDYVWNAWHFAAQHHGVYRIYRRQASKTPSWFESVEKWGLRGFLLYVILRVAGGTWRHEELESALRWADCAVAALPLGLWVREWRTSRSLRSGAGLYLTSVCGLYLTLLWAVHARQPRLVLLLATASALFHALEYLTLVGWSMHRHHARRSDDRRLITRLAPQWGLAIVVFAVVLGASGWWLEHHLLEAWLFANVVMAFVHYAFDGVIWRTRRRAAA